MAGAAVALVAVLASRRRQRSARPQPAKQQATPLKVALVTDIGGLNDKGFNALAYNGLKVAQTQLGIKGRVLHLEERRRTTSRTSRLRARQGYDLVIASAS